MILAALAAEPSAPSGALVVLTEHALRTGDDRTLRALAGNPSLPLEQTVALLTVDSDRIRAAVARRVDAQQARELVRRASLRKAVLSHFLLFTDDPQDVLVHLTAAISQDAALLSQALAHATTPDGARDAALALAQRPRLTKKHVNQLKRHLVRHPDDAGDLLDVVRPAAALSTLAAFLDARQKDVPRGAPAWFQHSTTSTQEAISYASRVGTATVWLDALLYSLDETGHVARAAVQACPRSVRVLGAVVQSSRLPVDVREDAAIALLRIGRPMSDKMLTSLRYLVLHGSVTYASRYATLATMPGDVSVLADRDDLTTDGVSALHAAAEAMFARRTNDATIVVHQRPVFGALLATHPNASLDVRQAGERWARDWSHPSIHSRLRHGRANGAEIFTACAQVAAHGLNLEHQSPAVIGAQLPVSALAGQGASDVPGVKAMVGAALRERMGDVGAGVDVARVAVALIALTGGFTGTVGELWDTAVAVAS